MNISFGEERIANNPEITSFEAPTENICSQQHELQRGSPCPAWVQIHAVPFADRAPPGSIADHIPSECSDNDVSL